MEIFCRFVAYSYRLKEKVKSIIGKFFFHFCYCWIVHSWDMWTGSYLSKNLFKLVFLVRDMPIFRRQTKKKGSLFPLNVFFLFAGN